MMQSRTKEQRQKEEIQSISSIDYNRQGLHLRLQHLSNLLSNHTGNQRFKDEWQKEVD